MFKKDEMELEQAKRKCNMNKPGIWTAYVMKEFCKSLFFVV